MSNHGTTRLFVCAFCAFALASTNVVGRTVISSTQASPRAIRCEHGRRKHRRCVAVKRAPIAAIPAVPACPAGVPVQTITLVNNLAAPALDVAMVERAAVDQSLQLRAAWNTPCVQFGAGGWVFTLNAAQPQMSNGATSYTIEGEHFDANGVVSATVDSIPYAEGGTMNTWARPLTHEMDEALVDPTTQVRNSLGLVEVCDPVENWTYPVDGVQVTDFTLPTYFNEGPGPWDHLGQLTGDEQVDRPIGL